MATTKAKFNNFLFGSRLRQKHEEKVKNNCVVCNGTGKVQEYLLVMPPIEVEKDCWGCANMEEFTRNNI